MTKYEDYELRQFKQHLAGCECENKVYSIVKSTKSVNNLTSRSSFNRMYEEVAYTLTNTDIPQKERVVWLVRCDGCGYSSYHDLKRDAKNFKEGMLWIIDNEVL